MAQLSGEGRGEGGHDQNRRGIVQEGRHRHRRRQDRHGKDIAPDRTEAQFAFGQHMDEQAGAKTAPPDRARGQRGWIRMRSATTVEAIAEVAARILESPYRLT